MIPSSAKGGIILLLAVVGCTGNLFIILTVATRRTLHTMHHFLLANLALSDFLLQSLIFFVAVSKISEQWIFGIAWCKGNHYILQCLVYTTILLLCAVTWECHTAVVKPYDFSGDITIKKITVVVLLWTASFVFGSGQFFGWGRIVYNDKLYRCDRDFKVNDLGSAFFTIVLFLIIPFGLITKQQYQINSVAKHLKSQVIQQHNAVINLESAKGRQHRKLMKNLKASKDALIIVVAFVVSYLPIGIAMVLRRALPESEELYNAWFLVSILCGQIGATCNPIIYCFRKRQFRRQILRFLGVKTFGKVAPQVT